jgi:integrase
MGQRADQGAADACANHAEIVKVWNALRDDDYSDIVRLLTLTLCRLSEIGDLTWDEVDFPAGLIRLLAARTKTGVARDVPMSAPVRRILDARQQHADGGRAPVFGTGQGGFAGWTRAKAALDQRAGVSGWTHHDLRLYGSTTMNNESIALPHIIEAVLGHAVGDKIARTYNLAAYPEQVRAQPRHGTGLGRAETREGPCAAAAEGRLMWPIGRTGRNPRRPRSG